LFVATHSSGAALSMDGLRVCFLDRDSGLCWCTVNVEKLVTEEVRMGIFSLRGTERIRVSPPRVDVNLDRISGGDADDLESIGRAISSQRCGSSWIFSSQGSPVVRIRAGRVGSFDTDAEGNCILRFDNVTLQRTGEISLEIRHMTLRMSARDGVLEFTDSAGHIQFSRTINQIPE